jgi:hypothetical protein
MWPYYIITAHSAEWFFWLVTLNSVLNPWIYICLNRDLQERYSTKLSLTIIWSKLHIFPTDNNHLMSISFLSVNIVGIAPQVSLKETLFRSLCCCRRRRLNQGTFAIISGIWLKCFPRLPKDKILCLLSGSLRFSNYDRKLTNFLLLCSGQDFWFLGTII